MSLGDMLPVQFYQVAFLCAFVLLPVLAFRGDIENYFFGLGVLYMCVRVVRRRMHTTLPADDKAVFISGCDTGFGHLTAIRLDGKGYTVFAGCLFPDGEGATALKDKCSDRLQIVPLDVTSDESVRKAGEYVRDHLGSAKLWALVNNAGIYGHGDVELCSVQTYMKLADVNLYGMIRLTQEFLPLIRQSQGRVVNMSSMHGRHPWPCTSAYNASKYGVECVSDCLRLEMVKFGVKVILVEPAMFGGTTNIHSEENVSRHHDKIDQQWADAKPEVRDTYSREYMKDQIDGIVHFKQKLDAKSPDVVIDAFESAVNSTNPEYRYVCHGGPFPFDPLAVFGLVYPYLPEFLTDWLICKVTRHNGTAILKLPPAATVGPSSTPPSEKGDKRD